MIEIINVIKNKIMELRRKQGLTQEQLADDLGVTRQTIISIEKGKYVPSLALAMKIAIYFNLSIEKIFTNEKA